MRGLARHSDVIDDVENELHALIASVKQTNPELLDVLLPYIGKLSHRY
ncbi:hypothetical protein MZA97_09470 [Haemophilus influenzae]|nr:hypothetical protein [Haemophilus influenzae]